MVCAWESPETSPLLFTFGFTYCTSHLTTYYLLERCRFHEHLIHVGGLCHVVFGQVLVKIFENIEHIMHVYEFANSPLEQVPIEGTGLTEDNKDHVGNLCHVPFLDRAVRRTRGTIAHRLQFA